MKTFLQDIRFAFRMLSKHRSLSAIVIITVGLGVGASSTMFSVVNAVLLRSLPYKNADQLVLLWEMNRAKGINEVTVTSADYVDWRNQNHVFEDLGVFLSWAPVLRSGGESRRIPGALCSASLFTLLGVKPVLGRTFRPDENRTGSDRFVLLSYGFWKSRYAANPRIIGERLVFDEFGNKRSYTIIGVMPPDFRYPYPLISEAPQIWGNITIDPDDRRGHLFGVLGRLRSGVTLAQARSEMETIAARLDQQFPVTNAGWRIIVVPLYEQVVRNVRTMLLILFGAVGFVLLIACANVVNLLLTEAEFRKQEFAIRTAVGCGKWRLVRQLFVERLLLSGIGGALSFLVAVLTLPVLLAIIPETLFIPRIAEASIDGRVFGFILAISSFTGLVFGMLPALNISDSNLLESLNGHWRGNPSALASAAHFNPGSLLAVGELALAFILLTGAGLMIRSFIAMQHVDFGFDRRNLLVAQVTVPNTEYLEKSRRISFFDEFLQRIENLPGVESVAAVDRFPPVKFPRKFNVDGGNISNAGSGQAPFAEFHTVTPEYFKTLDVSVLRGRGFEATDNLVARRVIVVNQTMARRFWTDDDPLGKRLTIQYEGKDPWTIVGVVKDIKGFEFKDTTTPEIYNSFRQEGDVKLLV